MLPEINNRGVLNRGGGVYPANEWRLVPLGHWNWKCNQVRAKYSTYDQELLSGMLVPYSLGLLCGSVTKSR